MFSNIAYLWRSGVGGKFSVIVGFCALGIVCCAAVYSLRLLSGTPESDPPIGLTRETAADLGQTVKGLRYEFTVTEVQSPAGLEGNFGLTRTPDEGNIYMLIALKVVCKESGGCSFYSSDWQLINRNGELFDEMGFMSAGVEDHLVEKEVIDGGTTAGQLGFEVPSIGGPYLLTYDGKAFFKLR